MKYNLYRKKIIGKKSAVKRKLPTKTIFSVFSIIILLGSCIPVGLSSFEIKKEGVNVFQTDTLQKKYTKEDSQYHPDITETRDGTFTGNTGYKPWYYYIGSIINSANGNLYLVKKDLSVMARGYEIDISRSYNSLNCNFSTGFGYGWTFNYNTYLIDNEDYVLWVDGDGAIHNFTRIGAGNYLSPTGLYVRLTKYLDNTYILWFTSGMKFYFNTIGILQKIVDKNGNILDLIYFGNRLIKIQDDSGLYLNIFYNSQNLIEKIEDPLGRRISYDYDLYGNLVNVTDAMGNSTLYRYYNCHRLANVIDKSKVTIIFSYYDNGSKIKDVRNSVYQASSQQYANPFLVYLVAYQNQTTFFLNAMNYASAIRRNTEGNPVQIIDSFDGTTHLDWVGNRIMNITDQNGNTYSYNYDTYGNVIQELNPFKYETRYDWETNDTNDHLISLLTNITKIDYQPLGSPVDIFNDSLEPQPQPGWKPSLFWMLMSGPFSHSHPNSWACAGGWYGSGWHETLQSPGIDLSNYTDVELTFWHMRDFEGNPTVGYMPDGGNVKISIDGGKHWTLITPDTGYDGKLTYGHGNPMEVERAFGYSTQGQWVQDCFDLTAYVGRASNVSIRFEMGTDNSGPTGNMGWYIDDIVIHGYTASKKEILTHYRYDENGNMVEIQDARGNRSYRGYDSYGNMINATDFKGYITYLGYDPHGNNIDVIDPTGNITFYDYDCAGRLLNITDAKGFTTTYFYDDNNRVTKIVDATGNETQYIYSAAGALISMIDKNGNQMNYTTNVVGGIEKTEDPTGNSTFYTYNRNGQVIKSTDPVGKESVIEYDPLNRPIAVTDPAGFTEYYGYDAVGNIIWYMDKTYAITHYEYDKVNRLTRVIDPLNSEIVFRYDEFDNVIQWTDKNKHYTLYEYDELNRKIQRIAGLPSVHSEERYGYDANSNIISFTNGNNHTFTYEYNKMNRVIKITDPRGNYSLYSYDAVGNLKTVRDQNAHITTYDYDPLNQLKTVLDSTGNTTQYTYDAMGNLETVVNARGYTTTYSYDDLYRLVNLTDASRNSTQYRYDAVGNLIQIIDANGGTTNYSYNAVGLVETLTSPLGYDTRYEYDPLGNINKITDANGNVTQFSYDLLGRLTMTWNPIEGNYLYFGYDKKENLISVTDAQGNPTTYMYDDLDQLTQVCSPLGFTTKYVHDGIDNMIQREDANGVRTNYTYDELDRLTRVDYPVGYVTFGFDAVGNIVQASNHGIGLNDTIEYTYDTINRMISVKTNYGTFKKTINYTYDEVGNVKTIIDPDGGTITYTYNPINRVSSITDQDYDVTTFTYNTIRKRIQTVYPNGAYTNYTWNKGKNLLDVINKNSRHEILSSYNYTYDHVGNRLTMTDLLGLTTTYKYDTIYRLNEVAYPSGTVVQYTYNTVDNRRSTTLNYTTTTWYQYDTDNRLTSDGVFTYNYDNNGNLIQKTNITHTTNYAYDYENRLVHVTLPDASVVRNTYSPLWSRSSRDNGTDTTFFCYDQEDILQEYDTNGVTKAHYLHSSAIDEPISIKRSSMKAWYLLDGLGSVTSLMNVSQDIINTYEYDVFGEITQENETLSNFYKYTSREYDEDTDLSYNRLRFYDPELGRFTTKDPLGMINGANLYMYVQNNPVTHVDPWGEQITEHGTDMEKYKNDPDYRKCINDAWAKYNQKLDGKIKPLIDPDQDERQRKIAELRKIIDQLEEISKILEKENQNRLIQFIGQYVVEAIATVVTAPMGGWGGIAAGAAIRTGGNVAIGAITDASPQEQFVGTIGTAAGSVASGSICEIGATPKCPGGTSLGSLSSDVGFGLATQVASDAVTTQPQVPLADTIAENANTNSHWIRSLIKNQCYGALKGCIDLALKNLKKQLEQLEKEGQKASDETDARTRPILDWAKKELDADIKMCNVVITHLGPPTPDPTPQKPPKKEEEPKNPPMPPTVTHGSSSSGSTSGSSGSSQGRTVTTPGYNPAEPGTPKLPTYNTTPKCNWTDQLDMECKWNDTSGMAPGTGGDFGFCPTPESYCDYRIIYFGSNIIDDTGENHKVLYNAIKWAAQHSKKKTTTVLVMPSWGGYDGWIMWQNFAVKYPDISLIRWSSNPLTRDLVTYSGLQIRNPDVLIDSDHFSSSQQGGYYTPNEVQAIQKYLLDEHGYIATYGTLGDNPGQSNQTTNLLTLLGLKETEDHPHKYGNSNPWVIDSLGHPLFFNISMTNWQNAGNITGNVDIGVCPLCGEEHLGAKLAHLQSTEGNHYSLISAYTLLYAPLSTGGLISQAGGECIVVPQTVYFPNNIIENTGQNHNILYKSIKWAAENDSTQQTKVLIMPGWGGYDGWSQWQTFATTYPDITLLRWSNNNSSRTPVTTYALEVLNADVLIESNHSSSTQQGGFYTIGELQAIDWYVKTRGHGMIVTSGSLGNNPLQTNQTLKLLELLGINNTAAIQDYSNSESWIIDQPSHPIITSLSTWNPGRVTANLINEEAEKVAHLYSTQGNHHTLISAYEGFGKGTCTCECNIPPRANFTWTPSSPTTQDTIQFSDVSQDPDGSIVNWTWDFDDGNQSYEQNPTHQYTSSDTYNVTLIVYDNQSEPGSITKAISITMITGPVQNLNTHERFFSIQSAIDDPDTLNGHTIFVGNGTYPEHLVVNKRLTITGEEKNTTIIDCEQIADVIVITVDRVNISQFTITKGGSYNGILLGNVHNVSISNNIINNSLNGIAISSSSDTTITNNYISDNLDDGVDLYQSSHHNTIAQNTFSANAAGVFINGSTFNIIDHNKIDNSTVFGVQLYNYADHNQISNNSISRTDDQIFPALAGVGVFLFIQNHYNEIRDNTIYENKIGVSINYTSTQNIITGNIIINNSARGIQLYSSSTGNVLYHNNLINNTQNAYDECTNTWNKTYPLGGNYWSDYTGSDTHSGPGQTDPVPDGIGDTPYNISGGSNQDHYPFMEPNGWLIPTPQPPNTPIHVADGCHTHDHPNDMNKGIGKLPCFVQPPHGVVQTFSTTSSNTGQIYYKFFFGDGTDSGWLGPYTNGQVATITHDYNNIGVFQVTAKAKVGAIESLPSPPLSVRMYKSGDINGDNLVDFGDINPFVSILTNSKVVWYNQFPTGYWWTGDINNDCSIDFGDINPFVQELTSCPP